MIDVRATAIAFLRLPETRRISIARSLDVLGPDEEPWWPRVFTRIREGGLIDRLARELGIPESDASDSPKAG